MVKKLTALLFSALFITGAALAAKEDVAADATETKKTSRYSRNRKNKENGNKGEVVVATEDTYSRDGHRHGRYNGGSCSTGACGVKKASCHSHACRESNCGVCSRKDIPNKPCCEKAVTVRTEPCLHKHVEYSWTCPVDYTETACPTC